MKATLSDAFEGCLREMERGRTLEAVLLDFPAQQAELRPLLELAQTAREMGRSDAPSEAAARSRTRFLAAAARLRASGVRRSALKRPLRFAFAALVVIVFLAASVEGALAAASHSLPGDALYPLKRLAEDIELRWTSDPGRRQQIEDEFRQRRLDETRALIADGRTEMIEFYGMVTAAFPGGWLVADIPVAVTAQTRIEGRIGIGVEVRVAGETRADGKVWALGLTRAMADFDDPVPVLSASPTPDSTPEPANGQTDPADTPRPVNTNKPPTNTPRPVNTHKPPTNTPRPVNTNKPPTNTPRPVNTHKPPTNTPRPANTHKPLLNLPGLGAPADP